MPRLEGPVPQVQAKEGPMPQPHHKRRARWATLAVGALIATLLATAGPAGPAAAATGTPDNATSLTACIGDATEDKMFPDVSEGHYFRDAINCLAYYGVTVGYEDGTFKPNDNVARAEMVLFMERAAGIAGVSDASTVVGDFATTGSDPVNRADMALLIARLLAAATDTVGTAADGTFTVGGKAADDFFADVRGGPYNRVTDSATSVLYETGVAMGTGMNMFSPAATVSRGAMAAFITRALAHTSARPSGLTVQTKTPGEVLVSVRDANFAPVPNAPVDIFSIDTDKAAAAFNEDGTCGKLVKAVGNTSATGTCAIDALDDATKPSGDLTAKLTAVAKSGTTVWTWTGDEGDKVEDGAEGIASINLTEVPLAVATGAKATNDLPAGATRAVFGSTVTVTIQLIGAGDANAAPISSSGTSIDAKYNVTIRRESDLNQATDGAVTAVTGGTTVSTVSSLPVDASGKGTFTITASDPDPSDSNNADGTGDAAKIDRTRVTYTIATASGGMDVATGASATITFSDAKAKVTSGKVETATKYKLVPTSGSASNVATVTVTDQFGMPMRGHAVVMTGDANSSFPTPRTTDSTGKARIGYSHSGTTGVDETLVARSSAGDTDPTDDPPIGGTDPAVEGNAAAIFYWVAAVATDATGASGTVNVADIEQKTLIVGNTLVIYDSNDQFESGPTGSIVAVTMAAFEEALKADTTNNDQIVVSSYKVGDASDVAKFVLTVN